jgi:hypothetical protein
MVSQGMADEAFQQAEHLLQRVMDWLHTNKAELWQ